MKLLPEFTLSGETFGVIESLYEKYLDELTSLTREMSELLSSGIFEGNPGTYDIEGELYYLLCRETGARTILEMASSNGWSTLYLALAAAKNANGAVIHSFELDPKSVLRFRKNVSARFPFVVMHEGDCRKEFLKLSLQDSGEFDFVLLDVHPKDFPQFAFKHILPRASGIISIHDLLPDQYPRNHPETVFFLWLLLRGGIPFLPIAALLEHEGIQRLRKDLTPRRDHLLRGPRPSAAKGILLSAPGAQWQGPLWDKLTAVTYDQFPPRGLEQYTDIPERFFNVSHREFVKECFRRLWRGGR